MLENEISAKILTKLLGKSVHVTSIKQIGSGLHSDGYHVETKDQGDFFIKKVKAHDLGFEFIERKIASLLTSHTMAKNANANPQSLGVFIGKDDHVLLPSYAETDDIYHVQQFAGIGTSYLAMIENRKNKKAIDGQDKKEIDKIVSQIVEIHKKEYPDATTRRFVYNDSLRAIMNHPEYLFTFLQKMNEKHPVLPPKEQTKLIGNMLDVMHHFTNKDTRVTRLHGDFWGANLFFRPDGTTYLIDYSRIPWGDPAYDIGFWISSYIWSWHETANDYYKQLTKYFIKKYIAATGDTNVLDRTILSLGLIAAIYAFLELDKQNEHKTSKAFLAHITKMLKKKKFFWGSINKFK